MTIAITGATGQLGGLVIEALLERVPADQLVALVRTPAKAAGLKERGVDVRAFDYDDASTLEPALAGVDRLVFVSGNAVGSRVPQHRAVVDAATRAGVPFVAYTSFLHTDDASIVPVAAEHQATEAMLNEAPFAVALLRNGWYTENFADAARQAAASGVLAGSAGDGRISAAERSEYAEAAAVVVAADRPEAGVYELGGDASWTYADFAAAVGKAAGTTVEYRNVSADEHRKILTDGGLPEGAVGFLVTTDAAIAAGELEDPKPGTLSRLLGRPTSSLDEAVAGWVNQQS